MAMTVDQQKAIALAQAAKARANAGAATAEPEQVKSQDIGDVLSAGFTKGIDSIPFVGPTIMGGLNNAKAFVHTNLLNDPMTAEQVNAENKALEEQNPVASTVGEVAGTALPLMALPELPAVGGIAGRLLGMTGPLGARMGLGAASTFGIETGDAMMRGDDPLTALGKGAVGGAVGGVFPAVTHGVGSLWRLAAGRQVPQEVNSVARALRDDNVPPSEIPQRLSALGPDAMLMDLGPNLQAQAGALASVPGNGQTALRDAIATRGRGASQRVADDVSATIGNGPDLETLKTGVVQAQSAAADPLYSAIRDVPIDAPPIVKSIMQRPMGQRAIRAAVDMAANDGYHFPVNGNVMTVGLADYMKRALDDIATTAARAGNNNQARQARNMTRAITGAVDRIVPAYKQARDAFAGPAQVMDAIDQGSAVFGKDMSPTQLRTALRGMSASERDGFLQGAQAQIEGMMGNAVNDVATLRNTFRKGWNENKLRILLGDNVADDLLRRIDRELTYGNTSNVVARNSETARRLASQAEVSPQTGTVSQPGKTFLGLVFDAFNAARNGIEGVRRPEINSRMARMHTARANDLNPRQIRQLEMAARQNGPAIVAPAAPAILEERRRQPIHITVGG